MQGVQITGKCQSTKFRDFDHKFDYVSFREKSTKFFFLLNLTTYLEFSPSKFT